MNITSKILLDRLHAHLEVQGVKLKRSQVLEAASAAFGFFESNEFTAAAKRGDLDPAKAIAIGRVEIGAEAIIIVRDPVTNAPYGIDEAFVAGPIEDERRERFGPSPYGNLLDLSDLADTPVTSLTARPTPEGSHGMARYRSYNGRHEVLWDNDDIEAAKAVCKGDDGRTDLDAYIVDRTAMAMLRARTGWVARPLDAIGIDVGDRAAAAARMAIQADEVTRLDDRCKSLVNLGPDWGKWETDLKKASHRSKGPIDDETLFRFRHAVADAHCKSSACERSTVDHRQRRFVELHLGGLMARLDAAEDAVRAAGVEPTPRGGIGVITAEDAMAAINAVDSAREGDTIPGLFQVDATRDGNRCREVFHVDDDTDAENRAREIVAKEFDMTLDDFADEDDDVSSFDSECDSFYVEQVTVSKADAIMGDVLSEIAHLGHTHPARIKLIAAREELRRTDS